MRSHSSCEHGLLRSRGYHDLHHRWRCRWVHVVSRLASMKPTVLARTVNRSRSRVLKHNTETPNRRAESARTPKAYTVLAVDGPAGADRSQGGVALAQRRV